MKKKEDRETDGLYAQAYTWMGEIRFGLPWQGRVVLVCVCSLQRCTCTSGEHLCFCMHAHI